MKMSCHFHDDTRQIGLYQGVNRQEHLTQIRSLDRLVNWTGTRTQWDDTHGLLAIWHVLEPTSGFPSRDDVLLRADVRNVDAANREDVARKVVVRRRPVFVNRFHPRKVGAA